MLSDPLEAMIESPGTPIFSDAVVEDMYNALEKEAEKMEAS